MARNRANIRTDMWGSPEWRKLSTGAQWLYMYLLTSPTLSYVGISDWRPGRIAAKVGDADAAEIVARAAELEAGRFVFVDEDTEEALVRSFLRHDGLLLNSNLWRSIGNDFADASSERLRGIVAHEARRLRDEHPDGYPKAKSNGFINPWVSPALATLLDAPTQVPAPRKTKDPTEAKTAPSGTGTTEGQGAAAPRARKPPYSENFLAFWEMGLRKDDKIAAWRAWEKARKAGVLPDLDTLRVAVKAYLDHNPDPTFRKYPATWLNAGGWENEYDDTPAERPSARRDETPNWMKGDS